jgi:hypothetical protein
MKRSEELKCHLDGCDLPEGRLTAPPIRVRQLDHGAHRTLALRKSPVSLASAQQQPVGLGRVNRAPTAAEQIAGDPLTDRK